MKDSWKPTFQFWTTGVSKLPKSRVGFEDMPASGIECAKFYEALQVVVDIAAKHVSRCFDFELCFANQERKENCSP